MGELPRLVGRLAVTPFDSILGAAWPVDGPGWIALFVATTVGIALAVPPVSKALARVPFRFWVGAWAILSVVLSAGYVHYYLMGGPRIIDATSYWLEARSFASGLLSWGVEDPTASVRGRFLVHREGADGLLRLGVIFPPGYPVLLSLGFLFGVPMLVGPVLAGCLTVLTALLGRSISGREDVGRIAAVLSALNACLRYHTADTMSHGLAAVLLTGAVLAALQAAKGRIIWWVLCGVAWGWLGATRPASALALCMVGLPLLSWWMVRHRTLRPLWLAAGAIPWLLALGIHQHALTGTWLSSAQSRYYLLADGPAGCFRYGFGSGIGCLVEHGPYVESMAPNGFGLGPAMATTGRRVYLHLADILNYAPFVGPLLLGLWEARRNRIVLLALAVPVATVLAYSPFYFDGSYPGGGARMLVDAMAFEHVLVALGLLFGVSRIRDHARGQGFAVATAVLLCALGFSIHAGHMHKMLRERDGGRPLFEPARVHAVLGEPPRGLLFMDTDHGFNLAYDPAARDPRASLIVARARHDSRDWMLWKRLGQPASYRYVDNAFAEAPTGPRVETYVPEEPAGHFVFETEAEWPPLDQEGGYAAPSHLSEGCVSSGRVLAVVRVQDEVCVSTEIPAPPPGVYGLRAWMVSEDVPKVRAWVQVGRERMDVPLPGDSLESWAGRESSQGRSCLPTEEVSLEVGQDRLMWVVCSKSAWLGLDRVELRSRGGL